MGLNPVNYRFNFIYKLFDGYVALAHWVYYKLDIDYWVLKLSIKYLSKVA
jgi:hypothetical protein